MERSLQEKRLTIFTYINTVLLTLMLTVFTYTANALITIEKDQTELKLENVRLRTTQEANVANVQALNIRVSGLELGFTEDLKIWVDNNYVRKPQK